MALLYVYNTYIHMHTLGVGLFVYLYLAAVTNRPIRPVKFQRDSESHLKPPEFLIILYGVKERTPDLE